MNRWGDVLPLPPPGDDPLFDEVRLLLQDLVGIDFDPLAAARSWQDAGWARYGKLVRERGSKR